MNYHFDLKQTVTIWCKQSYRFITVYFSMKLILVYTFIPEMVLFLVVIRVKVVYTRYLEKSEIFSSGCGHSRSAMGRVSGGDEVQSGEFPWITSIQSRDGDHFCGGFVISNRFLISAAHCFSKKHNPKYIQYEEGGKVIPDSIRVATDLLHLSDTHADPSKLVHVKKIILHPEFDEILLNNDIAILELRKEIDLTPICLPNSNDEVTEGNVTVAGWGYRQCQSPPVSNELHKIVVPLWSADACKKSYTDADYAFARRDYVCAGSDGKDVNQGDSGGSLAYLNSARRWVAIGIVSAGRLMCTDKVPGVFIKVSSYINWIKNHIESEY